MTPKIAQALKYKYWNMVFDQTGISGVGRQPAPFEETKEYNLPPPTPGAGLIAAGRIPGGKN